MPAFSQFKLRQAVHHIHQGGLLAYPTEAVYGLGCDPLNSEALSNLLAMKQRSANKGLILIAADFDQLAPFLKYDAAMLSKILPTWPAAVTWIIPAQSWVPKQLTGYRDSLAVRVTAHPLVRQLCQLAQMPLVSTSANPHQSPPARSSLKVRQYFQTSQLFILSGATLGHQQPSRIYDARTGQRLR